MKLCDAVEQYIHTSKGLPFFYIVGDDQYSGILDELMQRGFHMDRTSDFCPKDDKVPSIDNIIDHFRTLDIDYKGNRHVLVGLGEYLALRGGSIAEVELRRLIQTTLGNARVVVLLRCVTPQMYAIAEEDHNRLVQQKRIHFEENAFSNLTITITKYSLQSDASHGIKGLLKRFEDGATGSCCVNTFMEFPNSLLPVNYVNSAYTAISKQYPYINVEEFWGTDQQWDQLYQELAPKNGSLDAIFRKYGFGEEYEEDFYTNSTGLEFRNWLFFLYLQQNIDNIPNKYLQYVLSVTSDFQKLKDNVLTEIIRIPRTDERFNSFYKERKKMVKMFSETDIAIFIYENNINPDESVYRLTDNTRQEQEEIIKWCSAYGYIPEIEFIYPALYQYIKEYKFNCGDLSSELTSYFQEYKNQKIANRIDPEFMDRVLEYAGSMPYAQLEARDSAILRVTDKKNTFLYWIDALGVEYLAYISDLVRQKGLSMRVDITYSQIPTITSYNRKFYDDWTEPKKEKESALDDIKHKDKGGYTFDEKHEAPVHLAAELEVIEHAINRAATELSMHNCKSFVIASDHGASRLAVIRRQEEKYDTDTKGEHSGRCCKEFPCNDGDIPNVIKDKGYYVLADYGRFKKSRAANVEVHGGATLEEVVVPVIALTLRKEVASDILIVNEDAIIADRKSGTTVMLYISGIEYPDKVSVIIDGKRYPCTLQDTTHFNLILSDQRRSQKNVSAAIYDGDDLIGNITFDIKGKFNSVEKKEFDDLTI